MKKRSPLFQIVFLEEPKNIDKRIAYIDYRTLDDEFYTLKRVCHLLEFDKLTLKEKCEAYAIRPQRNEVGEWGLTRYDLRKLHHTLYHEDRKNSGSQKDEGPWA